MSDPVSLVAGLILVMVAGGYALTQTTSLHLHWVVLLPSLLVVVGVAVIAVVARQMATAHPTVAVDGADPDPDPAADPDPDPAEPRDMCV